MAPSLLNDTVAYADVKVLDYRPGAPMAEYTSESWLIDLNGTKVWYERWSTEQSCGTQFYDEAYDEQVPDPQLTVTGAPLYEWDLTEQVSRFVQVGELDFTGGVVDTLVDAATAAYLVKYDEIVKPVINAVKATVFPFSGTTTQ